MVVLIIELRISQHLKKPDTMTWDQVIDHFLTVCKQLGDFCAWFCEVYIHGVFWPDTFVLM